MIGKLLLYLQGYLKIQITGSNVERFINICAYKGFHLWELEADNRGYILKLKINDYKKLKPIIKKTNVKIIILSKSGFPFLINNYNKRYLFFFGMFISIICLLVMSSFIWGINISGNIKYTTEDISNFLYDMDVKIGTPKRRIDCNKISRKIRESYNEITWVSVSLNGSKININIRENNLFSIKNESEDKQDPYDIVSNESCQIAKIVVRNGIPCVHENDYVKKGTVLVSGKIPIMNDSKEIIDYKNCISNANIYGKKQLYYDDTVIRKYIVKEKYDVKKTEYNLKVGNYRVSLGSIKNSYPDFTTYTHKRELPFFDFTLKQVIPYRKIKYSYTDKELEHILSDNFRYYCNELKKKDVVILQNNVKIYTWSDKAVAKGNLTIEFPVGRLKKSEIKEIGDTIDGNDGNHN